MKKCLWFILLFSISVLVYPQKVTTELLDKSWLIIKGKSNVVDFSFKQNGDQFIKRKMAFTANKVQDKVYLSENTLLMNIKKFQSDNKMALKDFFKLVKADEYPDIRIKLDYFEVNKEHLKKPNLPTNVHLIISITGVENKYTIPVTLSNQNDKLQIKGSKMINIKDFGLTPSPKLLGLIKISEWIEIDFQINIALSIEN